LRFEVAELPLSIYSGRNLTRRSSNASAWRKVQMCVTDDVSGSGFPRKTPTEETVSLRRL
jgi:hypothetical protein